MSGSTIIKLQHRRRPALTAEELFALFRAAVKDDQRLVDAVIGKIHDDLVAYDHERARAVMELLVRREPLAPNAFEALLTEARDCRSRAAPSEDLCVSYWRSVSSGAAACQAAAKPIATAAVGARSSAG
jgi:hypothetical protein